MTLKQKIATEPDAYVAWELARFGKKLSVIERYTWLYLRSKTHLDPAMAPQRQEHGTEAELRPTEAEELSTRFFQRMLNFDAKWFAQSVMCDRQLADALLEAIEKGDGNTIRAVASIAEGWRDYANAAEPTWAAILRLKDIFGKQREPITAKQLAREIDYRGKDLGPIRKICKQLQWKLARDLDNKGGRPQKLQTRKGARPKKVS